MTCKTKRFDITITVDVSANETRDWLTDLDLEAMTIGGKVVTTWDEIRNAVLRYAEEYWDE